jgi:CheY-like chemotaxis protein/two-component sensor histidine kinase
MLAGVSHELNNPLAAVIGQADLLAEDLEGTEHADRVSKIRRAADRCARIVQSFLAMARQKPPEYRTIQINDQVRAAVELTEYQMRAANVTVDLCLGEPLPAIAADPDQLHQVFANLLTNARQALEDCGEDRRITITTSRKGKTIKLTVADNGRGIDAATRERIFDPFFTTKDVGSGTGIGLSFSLGIIEAHGGTLTVEAAKIGTVFAITLPAESQNAEDSAPEAMASPQAKGRVLVIDDEQDVADTLKDLLTRLGLHTEVAIGGRAGQAALASGATFDLILSDIRMPDLDGPGLYAWMVETRPDLLGQVAFVTGDTMSSRVAAFLDEVNCPILEKPFTARSLSDLVAGVLGK